jgi:hypothetical protein
MRPNPRELSADGRNRLQGWLRQMTLDTTVAIVGTLVITLSFLILGVESLRPEGIVPAEEDVAKDLTRLFSGVWGSFGYWFLLIGIYVGFWDTVLTDQDGFGRLLGNGTRLIVHFLGVTGRWADDRFLMVLYLVTVLAIVPIAVFLWIGEPVPLLQFAGITEAVHIPIVTGLVLYLNQRVLPTGLRASAPVFWITVAAGVFFLWFAGFFAAQELGWN